MNIGFQDTAIGTWLPAHELPRVLIQISVAGRPFGQTQCLGPQTLRIAAAQAEDLEGPSDAVLAHTGPLSVLPRKRLIKQPEEKPRVSFLNGGASCPCSSSSGLFAGHEALPTPPTPPTPIRPSLPPIGRQHIRQEMASGSKLGTSSSPRQPFGEVSPHAMHARLGRMCRDSVRPSSAVKRWGGRSPASHSDRSHTSSCPTLPQADDEDDCRSASMVREEMRDEMLESNARLRSMLSTLRPDYERLRDENDQLRRRLLTQSHQHKHSSPMGHL